MRILYLLDEYPYPLTRGPRVQNHILLNHMARDHTCHVLSFCDDDASKLFNSSDSLMPDIKLLGLFQYRTGASLEIARVRHILRGNPLFLARWDNTAFVEALNQALNENDYDLIHLIGIQMVPYLRICQHKPTVLSEIDAVSLAYRRVADVTKSAYQRAYKKFASWSIKRFEHNMLAEATKIHVVSQLDCQYLRESIPNLDAEFIEIVIPEDVINYPAKDFWPRDGQAPRVLLWGPLHTAGIAKGVELFLADSYPVIHEAFPDLQVVVLGRNAPNHLLKQMGGIPNLQYIEFADDICAELAKSHVIIFPDLSGTGIKNRALQAMALAKPLVGTPFTFENIPVNDGTHCFMRENIKDFGKAVICLLKDKNARDRMGLLARQFVLKKFSMQLAGPKWLDLYIRTVEKHAAQRRVLCKVK